MIFPSFDRTISKDVVVLALQGGLCLEGLEGRSSDAPRLLRALLQPATVGRQDGTPGRPFLPFVAPHARPFAAPQVPGVVKVEQSDDVVCNIMALMALVWLSSWASSLSRSLFATFARW